VHPTVFSSCGSPTNTYTTYTNIFLIGRVEDFERPTDFLHRT
jgi:hypothetical protein